MEGHVARMEGSRRAFKVLTGKYIGKRPLGRPRPRWEDNIRMNLKETGINTRNWANSAKGRGYWKVIVNTALNLRVAKVIKLYIIYIIILFHVNIHIVTTKKNIFC